MATPNVSSDMGLFFDFGEAALPDTTTNAAGDVLPSGDGITCPIHSGGCICYHEGRMLPEGQQQPVEPEWDPDFCNWLPRWRKPTHPCEYCRSRSLECFLHKAADDQSTGCSACNALFRPCSFSEPEKLPLQRSKTALDTLDVVREDSQHCYGGLTGRKTLRSLGHVGPIEAENSQPNEPKRGAAAARFPRAAVKILKEWLIMHIDHPYPTEEEKEALKLETGLTVGQISNWMANTRRRQKARPKRSASPSIRPSTEPVNIPAGRTWDDLNPLERWKHSPPENEPAPMTAIAQAVETFDLPEPGSSSSSYNGPKNNSNGSTGSFSLFRAPSTTSLETSFTNMSSGSVQSHGSAYSYGSRNSIGSLNSLTSKTERRRRRRMPTRTPKAALDKTPRLFQCTFCTDRFKSKYDWSRHEKSLHLSLEKWICAPLGEVITCSSSGQRKCVYCDALDPSKDHLAAHNHNCCEEKGLESRTFYRKDHLRQHLRLMHGCKMTASMESWKAEVQYIKSRCGFCGADFEKWQDRVDHLSKEFRNGAEMKDWRGCRGLDAHVAAHVTNAMPPYLIANESKSPFPFSASNSASMKHHNFQIDRKDLEHILPGKLSSPGEFIPHQMGDVSIDSSVLCSTVSPTLTDSASPQDNTSSSVASPHHNATCWEILTLRLGQFARNYIEQHGAENVTDDMLQAQARRILYDSDDPWNQTAADNPEWLGLFKKAHGIQSETPYAHVISQHEVLEELGLPSSARLDKSFNLQNFDCVKGNQGMPAYEWSLAGSTRLAQKAPEKKFLETTNASSSLPGLEVPISELMCTTPGGVCIGENGELGFSTSMSMCSMLAPVTEMACTAAADRQQLDNNMGSTGQPQDPFALIDWSQLSSNNNQLPSTTMTGGLSSSVPVSGMGCMMGMDSVTSDLNEPKLFYGWEDTDLDFGFEMDMDFDTSMDVNMEASGSNGGA